MQVKGVFYNKPVVTDKLEFYADAANINSFDPDDVTYNGASVNAQTAYTTAGTSSFTVPVGVTSISAVAVGAGGGGNYTMFDQYPGAGGGGGGLAYGTFTVTPGETLTIVVGAAGAAGVFGSRAGGAGGNSQVKRGSTVLLQGGGGGGTTDFSPYNPSDGGSGGTSTGTERDGGGSGGDGGSPYYYSVGQQSGGGGGAGGYSGDGGDGGAYGSGVYQSTAGSGGGGGGGGSDSSGAGNNGGGVGILGAGSNGTAGSQNSAGGAGSGGSGFNYGGGGGGGKGSSSGLSWNPQNGNIGSVGAVRLVYQPPTIGNRIYPDGSGTLSNIADATYSSPTNTWKDLTSNANNATLNFSDFDSNFGGSLKFNKNVGYRYYGNTSSDIFDPNSDFTISAWVKMPDSLMNNYGYTIVSDYNNTGSFQLRYFYNQGGIQVMDSTIIEAGTFSNSDILVASTWYNITVTRSSNTYTLYIDGSSISTFTSSNTYSHGSQTIGATHSSETEYWDGNIATVMAYSRALTAAEVLQNYNALKERYI